MSLLRLVLPQLPDGAHGALRSLRLLAGERIDLELGLSGHHLLHTHCVGCFPVIDAVQTSKKKEKEKEKILRVRFQRIGHARIETVGQYQSCMVSKVPI